MAALPDVIETVEQLEDILCTPSEGAAACLGRLAGDIMVLGAGGKVGPTLVAMAKRAAEKAGVRKRVVAVDVMPQALEPLTKRGVETIACDLLDPVAVAKLPQVENIVYMVGRKFGSSGSESLTWAINVMAAHNVARAFTGSRIAAFSTGCVYPVMDVRTGGATESTPPDPVGEYAQSCLGRERMFDYYAERQGERVVHVRLNYAVELRYGVLCDVAQRVWRGEPVDVTTGCANVIWQGDACNQVLQALELASSPATVLNVTGPETFSIRWAAQAFAERMGRKVVFQGEENGRGYLSNAARANGLFGNPSVTLARVIAWTAHWVSRGGASLGKATHFETQDGKY
jgi:nucleoside-diphosphate-sugar epimerase